MKRSDIPDDHVIELARRWRENPGTEPGVVGALVAEGFPEELALRKVEHLVHRAVGLRHVPVLCLTHLSTPCGRITLVNSYDGPVVLTTNTGVETDAIASFAVYTQGNMRSWSGTLVIDDDTLGHDLITAEYTMVKLPDGREGKVVVTRAPAGANVVHVQGSGKPPFVD